MLLAQNISLAATLGLWLVTQVTTAVDIGSFTVLVGQKRHGVNQSMKLFGPVKWIIATIESIWVWDWNG